MSDIQYHPLANILPLIEGVRFNDLVDSVRANGLRHPVILHEGMILDGRNRYRACLAAQVPVRFESFAGKDPIAFVLDENVHRRHLDEGQRSAAAAELCANLHISQLEAAGKLNVSLRSVSDAVKVMTKAPDVHKAVQRGEIPVSVAAKLSAVPEPWRQKALEADDKSKAARGEIARHNRNERLDDIVRKNGSAAPALDVSRKFPIIYADPPWRFDVHSRETGLERTPDRHYPTMSVEEICALPVSQIVPADEALLFLWITVPLLDRMDDIFRAWGAIVCDDPEYGVIRQPWSYVTHYIWDKERMGLGYWTRNQHEVLLLAKIGNVPAPLPPERQSSVHREIAGDHSAKPKHFAKLIQKHYPDVPKIELFCRGMPSEGFDAWGNQATARAA